MLELAWPYALIALPLPLLVVWLLPQAPGQPAAALRIPFFAVLADSTVRQRRSRPRLLFAALAWLLLLLAASRPQHIGEPLQLPISGRDLLLAVDISGSMNTPDMQLLDQSAPRLAVVKAVAGNFIERRRGDRLGLILFGSQAYLQVPFTFDRDTLRTLLEEAEIGLAGKETAVGDAIGLAVKRLRDQPPAERVLILLTDGANNTGAIAPLRAADLAVQENLRIYTIGFGADEMLVRGIFGTNRVNPSADLDEETLQQIAEKTGGRYFRARATAELEQIYQLLDELEPVADDEQVYRPIQELYPWPLASALLICLGLVLVSGLSGYAALTRAIR